MHTFNNTLQKMKRRAATLSVIFITVTGGYGILQAPEKKANAEQMQLEKELAQNAAALEMQQEEGALAEDPFMESTESPRQAAEASPQPTARQARGQQMGRGAGQQGLGLAPQKNNQETGRHLTGQKSTIQGSADAQAEPQKITAIGDSVLLGASPAVKKRFSKIFIDAKVSRQVYHAQEIAESLKKSGQLWDTVIIALGTNGNFNKKTGQDFIDFIGKKRTIYWVNVYGQEKSVPWQKTVNQTIQELAAENGNVKVIDWAKEAPSHEDWFYGDGIHLNTKGQKGYAKFLRKMLLGQSPVNPS